MALVSGRALSTLIACGLLWKCAGGGTFSWEGQDGTVLTPPSPGSESGDDPALDSDGQGEGNSDW